MLGVGLTIFDVINISNNGILYQGEASTSPSPQSVSIVEVETQL